MKIRTDFVTNSSSSSYCVSLNVIDSKKQIIKLDLWPKGEDGTGSVYVSLKTDKDKLIKKICKCDTIDKLKAVLNEALDFDDLAQEYVDVNKVSSNKELLKMLEDLPKSEVFENPWRDSPAELADKFKKFNEKLDNLSTLDEIKSIMIDEFFTAWGEYTEGGLNSFLSEAPSDYELPCDAEEICSFDANIETTIDMNTKKVNVDYNFEVLG